MNYQSKRGKQSQQAKMRQLGNTIKQRSQKSQQQKQTNKVDKNELNTSKTKPKSNNGLHCRESQTKLKRPRTLSQNELSKTKQPVINSSSTSVLSFDDIPLAMSASATPEPPFHQRSRNKNIVFLYDEGNKTSKEVSGHLGIALPVLAK